MSEKILINHKTVVFTKHARERLDLRRVGEDMIIQVMRSPIATHKKEDGKIKFVGKSMGAKVHVIGKPIPEQNKWLVISLWVRGEDDAGNFVTRRKYRREKPDVLSRVTTMVFLLLIFFLVFAFYLSQSG